MATSDFLPLICDSFLGSKAQCVLLKGQVPSAARYGELQTIFEKFSKPAHRRTLFSPAFRQARTTWERLFSQLTGSRQKAGQPEKGPKRCRDNLSVLQYRIALLLQLTLLKVEGNQDE